MVFSGKFSFIYYLNLLLVFTVNTDSQRGKLSKYICEVLLSFLIRHFAHVFLVLFCSVDYTLSSVRKQTLISIKTPL